MRVGDPVEASMKLDLGQLRADEVEVELVLGSALDDGELGNPQVVPLLSALAAGLPSA